MTAAEWIAKRRELLDAATEGPWETDGSEITQHWSLPEPWKTVASSEVVCGSYCYGGAGRGIEHATDAALIADARTSLPAALDALDAVLSVAARGAIGARGRGDSDEERRWLDLQIVIDFVIDSALKGTP